MGASRYGRDTEEESEEKLSGKKAPTFFSEKIAGNSGLKKGNEKRYEIRY